MGHTLWSSLYPSIFALPLFFAFFAYVTTV